MSGATIINILEKAMKYGRKYSTVDQILLQAEKAGVEVNFLNLESLSGVMVIGKKTHIYVNNQLSEIEQAHVLLHEKAHYELHAINRFCTMFVCRDSLIDYQEMEADYFAYLLSDDYLKRHCKWNFFRDGVNFQKEE